MTNPRIIKDLLSLDGDRVFTVTEKQFYGLSHGWTHLALLDEKSILESIYDQQSRPHTKAPDHRLNTQPKGCTCEDCQRFRKEDCPYPGSNITMDRCNSFLIDIEQHDAQVAHAATLAVLDKAIAKITEKTKLPISTGQRLGFLESIDTLECLRSIPQEPPK
jgi:hypothetical protein